MSKKKKIFIGIGIYLLICGVAFCFIYFSWVNTADKFYLIEFQKSVVLKEKFGEIVKAKRGIFEREKVYDENRLTMLGLKRGKMASVKQGLAVGNNLLKSRS